MRVLICSCHRSVDSGSHRGWLELVGLPFGNWEEVRMVHGFPGGKTGAVVVAQEAVQEVKGFRRDEVLVFRMDKTLPPEKEER